MTSKLTKARAPRPTAKERRAIKEQQRVEANAKLATLGSATFKAGNAQGENARHIAECAGPDKLYVVEGGKLTITPRGKEVRDVWRRAQLAASLRVAALDPNEKLIGYQNTAKMNEGQWMEESDRVFALPSKSAKAFDKSPLSYAYVRIINTVTQQWTRAVTLAGLNPAAIAKQAERDAEHKAGKGKGANVKKPKADKSPEPGSPEALEAVAKNNTLESFQEYLAIQSKAMVQKMEAVSQHEMNAHNRTVPLALAALVTDYRDSITAELAKLAKSKK